MHLKIGAKINKTANTRFVIPLEILNFCTHLPFEFSSSLHYELSHLAFFVSYFLSSLFPFLLHSKTSAVKYFAPKMVLKDGSRLPYEFEQTILLLSSLSTLYQIWAFLLEFPWRFLHHSFFVKLLITTL